MSDDHELVAGVAARDPEAFRSLMERHASFVINLGFRLLGTVADAEDVAQEVFLTLYQRPPTLSPAAKLSTWLYRVTVNRCLDLFRKRPRSTEFVPLDSPLSVGTQEELTLSEKLPDPSPSPRDIVTQAELATLTRRAIAALPSSLQAPLILSTLEQLSHAEIGEILGVTPKAAERRIARARATLKQRLLPYL